MKKQPNEETIYKKVIAEGFTRKGDPNFTELLSLAKYIRQDKKYGEKNIVRELVRFCKEKDEFFNDVSSDELLSSVAKAAVKNSKWREINFPIKILQGELDIIRTVKNYKFQLILLASISIAKSTGNHRIFSNSPTMISHIIEVSGVPYSSKLFMEEICYIATTIGLFTFVANRNEFFVLTSKEKGGVSIELKNEDEYYNLSEIYRNFIGGKLMWCKDCEKEMINVANSHKYCGTCSKRRSMEREKNRVRK